MRTVGDLRPSRRRSLAIAAGLAVAFASVAMQLVRLAVDGQRTVQVSISEPVATSFARPDIVDRNGRLLATDVELPSLYADPALILDRDEVVEKLARLMPGIDDGQLREQLADRSKRFLWIRRGLSPALAQQIHDLGLPGLAFRRELRRAYPAGRLAGHVLGHVNVDNRGMSGIERHIDDEIGVEAVHGATLSSRAPVRLSLDLAVQHAVEDELRTAMRRYGAPAAAGLVMDVGSGEIVASASLPDIDPLKPADALDPVRIDRLSAGTWELGSVFKSVTVAMALEHGIASPDTVLDVRQPLSAGRFTFKDLHPAGRPLTVAEVLVQSSNVGSGMLALEAGSERQRQFIEQLGLLSPLRTEAGAVAAPQVPESWGRAETITIAYGHGLALAPVQFAAAAGALVNGGRWLPPTFLKRRAQPEPKQVVSAETSARMRALLRRNVTDPAGTGRRADAAGYEVGGKTGTAELPVKGGYKRDAVIASFVGAFPMSAPRYLTLVMLFEPIGTVETRGQATAGVNAAPATLRLVERIAPLLGVPQAKQSVSGSAFDAPARAQ